VEQPRRKERLCASVEQRLVARDWPRSARLRRGSSRMGSPGFRTLGGTKTRARTRSALSTPRRFTALRNYRDLAVRPALEARIDAARSASERQARESFGQWTRRVLSAGSSSRCASDGGGRGDERLEDRRTLGDVTQSPRSQPCARRPGAMSRRLTTARRRLELGARRARRASGIASTKSRIREASRPARAEGRRECEADKSQVPWSAQKTSLPRWSLSP